MPEPSKQPPPSPGQPDRRALVEAFQDLVADEKAKRTAAAKQKPPARPRSLGLWITTVLAIGLWVALLVMRPAWLFTPLPPAESVEMQSASLRLAMAREVYRIERYRQATGSLPPTLADAGGGLSGLDYQRSGQSGYTLSGADGPVALTYHSTEPVKDFVGDAYDVIRKRGRP